MGRHWQRRKSLRSAARGSAFPNVLTKHPREPADVFVHRADRPPTPAIGIARPGARRPEARDKAAPLGNLRKSLKVSDHTGGQIVAAIVRAESGMSKVLGRGQWTKETRSPVL